MALSGSQRAEAEKDHMDAELSQNHLHYVLSDRRSQVFQNQGEEKGLCLLMKSGRKPHPRESVLGARVAMTKLPQTGGLKKINTYQISKLPELTYAILNQGMMQC